MGKNLLLLDIQRNEPGFSAPRVSVARCKRCYNPHEGPDMLKFLPWGLSECVMTKYSELSPSLHLTAEDVTRELDTHRVLPEKLVKHRLARGVGGKLAVQYLTHLGGLTFRGGNTRPTLNNTVDQ